MAEEIIQELKTLSMVPPQGEVFELWLRMQDAIAFLRDNVAADEFVVLASSQFAFVHAVLVPSSALNPPNVDDLLSWDCDATSSWGVWTTFGDIITRMTGLDVELVKQVSIADFLQLSLRAARPEIKTQRACFR